MLSCEACQLLIADALYEPLPASEQEKMQSHLRACQSCRLCQTQLALTTTSLVQRGVSPETSVGGENDADTLDGLWQNLQPALDKIDAERYRQLSRPARIKSVAPWLALAASIVLVVSVLPLITRSTNPDTIESPVAGTTVSPVLMDYLTRAEAMLLLVANAESDNVSTVPIQQTFARRMAMEASVLNTNMQTQINLGQSRLLKDIEFMLLQIANLDESNMEHGVALLQEYIEDNSVLFKIRLLEMRDQDVFI